MILICWVGGVIICVNACVAWWLWLVICERGAFVWLTVYRLFSRLNYYL